MNTVKVDKKNCKMVAHRGLSGIERENTNAAFVAAGNRSYYTIETDIHVTKDGKFVVYHDNSTGRLAEADVVVEETNLEDLLSFTLLDMDGTRNRCDLHMSTLEEYISICKKYEKVAVLELKNLFGREKLCEVIDIIKSMDYLENVIFISFFFDNLVIIRELLPEQKVQYLVDGFSDFLVEVLKQYKLDLDINCEALTEDIVKRLKEDGVEINCWTVDDKNVCEMLINWGVDFITTNILE